jgi:hypothetical protein
LSSPEKSISISVVRKHKEKIKFKRKEAKENNRDIGPPLIFLRKIHGKPA